MSRYRSTAPYPISPVATGTVCPGDEIDLDPDIAAPYIAFGHLLKTADPPVPTPPSTKKGAAPPETTEAAPTAEPDPSEAAEATPTRSQP